MKDYDEPRRSRQEAVKADSLDETPDIMQISSHEFPLQLANRRGSILPIFKESSRIPPHEWRNFSNSIHDASRFVRLSKPGEFSAAEMNFRANLDNYIPLGSITALLEHTDVWPCEKWSETSIVRDPANGCNDQEENRLHQLLEANIYRKFDFFDFQLDLLQYHGWIRTFVGRHKFDQHRIVFRVYVLPDDVGRRFISRDDKDLRKRLMGLMEQLDMSCESWEGRKLPDQPVERYRIESTNNDSLFYLFNTLSSPSPSASDISCSYAQEAVESLLENVEPMAGLKTELYPYQRRSAAMMLRREVQPAQTLDPRLEPLENPAGRTFYYDQTSGILLREQRVYEESRGGILAETMGLGKTLICLAAILATKGHWPRIPPEYSIGLHPTRQKVGSLMQMAASAIGRAQIPWRSHFQNLSSAGEYHKTCLALLEENIGSYVISAPESKRERRSKMIPESQRIRLCCATLIIVPSNLLMQWKSEIKLHFESESLNVLYLDTQDSAVPEVCDILPYDIILMTKQRFEREMTPTGTNPTAPKAKEDCTCLYGDSCRCSANDWYRSPLKDLHFLRSIVDEGHDFASSGGKKNAVWALQNLHVERRWVVSGTPASGLLGVEVGAATHETFNEFQENERLANETTLMARQKEISRFQEAKDLEKLGRIVVDFLNLRPWANPSGGEDPASWQKHIMPFEDGRRKARSLRAILESLVVRHQIQDIEADIELPPLHNRVVYLRPSWHDKLSINLFVLSLVANAVTSERVDEDYMFHHKNRGQLNQLITNMRQSGFFWTGFKWQDIAKTLDVGRDFLEDAKHLETTERENDCILLEQAMAIGQRALDSPSWTAFAQLQELGIFVEDFPLEARDAWSLVHRQTEDQPLIVGATQLAQAQVHVNSKLYASNPADALGQLGASVMERAWNNVYKAGDVATEDASDITILASPSKAKKSKGASESSISQHPKLKEKSTISKARAIKSTGKSGRLPNINQAEKSSDNCTSIGLKSALKSSSLDSVALIPSDSSLVKTRLIGTASAKLSYLLDRVIQLQLEEKILIFYEGDHIAYYIAQAFEILDIRYLIYTGTLSVDRLNAYITTFNKTETFRVMLMNVHQAAHGLHIASASRVFFVNPVWQPNVEAQAIKRAHRIGQTRPVYVETLVLENTLEDKMLKRRKGMNTQEHQQAEKSLLDDPVMGQIIRDADFIPLPQKEINDIRCQIARLRVPQQVFGRIGKGTIMGSEDPDADLIFPEGYSPKPKQSRKRKNPSVSILDKPQASKLTKRVLFKDP